jgi:hypothetical protein
VDMYGGALQMSGKEAEQLTAKLAELRAAYQVAQDAAVAKLNGPAKPPELPAEELEDIVARGEAKLQTELTMDQKRHMALMEQQGAFNAETQEMVRAHQAEVTLIEAKAITARMEFMTMCLNQQVGTVADKLIQMTATTATHSRAMFNINKAASLAKATIDGWESVQSSFKWGSAIGGPYVGAAFAAVAAVAAAANVQAIARTNFQGGGAGMAPSAATQPNTPVTQGGGGQGGGGGGDRTMFIKGISPDSLLTGRMVRQLADEMNEHVKDGGRVEWAQ